MLDLDQFIASLITKPTPQRKSPWRVECVTLHIVHQTCAQCGEQYTSTDSPPLTTFIHRRTHSRHSIADHPAALQAALPRKLTHTTQRIPACPACFTTPQPPAQLTLDLKPTHISPPPSTLSRSEGLYEEQLLPIHPYLTNSILRALEQPQ